MNSSKVQNNDNAFPELVTFGETMALMLPHGTKGIEFAPELLSSFGGAESNVAIGLARLGHSVGWFGALGNDPLGRMIFKKIRGEGVDVSRARLLSDAPTGLMLRETVMGKVSVYYYRRYSAASGMKPIDLDENYIKNAKILHITGITPALSATCLETVKEAMRIAKDNGVKICFDPNMRLKLWSIEQARPVLMEMAEQADLFLPGLDELKLLYGTDDLDQIVQELGRLKAVTIVKGDDRDRKEAYIVVNGRIRATVPWFDVSRVVDAIGAGDAFCAGFLAGYLKGLSLEESAKIGNYCGAVIVQHEGDWEGAPTWEQVEAVLQNRRHIER